MTLNYQRVPPALLGHGLPELGRPPVVPRPPDAVQRQAVALRGGAQPGVALGPLGETRALGFGEAEA